MITVKQAGVVAVRDIGKGLEFGLVKANSPQGELVLPKGHVEEGETLEGCALREAAEELGVAGILLSSVRYTHSFTAETNGQAETREVTYFPLVVTASVPTKEDRTVVWHTVAKAAEAASYPDHREMILRTRRAL